MEAKVHYRAGECCLFWASDEFDPEDYDSKFRIKRISGRIPTGPWQYIAEPGFADVIDAAREAGE